MMMKRVERILAGEKRSLPERVSSALYECLSSRFFGRIESEVMV